MRRERVAFPRAKRQTRTLGAKRPYLLSLPCGRSGIDAPSRSHHDKAMRRRRTLPHEPPPWIDPAREIWFLTICCRFRWLPQLTLPARAKAILETVAHRHESGLWHTHLFLLMPDHAHGLFSFPPDGDGMEKLIRDWKRWVARTHDVKWQKRFFDHRLRGEKSVREKADYILVNPVRAGLVDRWQDWPHLWIPDDAIFTGFHR